MILCDVVGEVVSTIKHSSLERRKLLYLQPVTPEGKPDGERFLALDAVGAGPGERVLVTQEGRSAEAILRRTGVPVRSIVVAVVDEVAVGGRAAYRKGGDA